MQILVCNSNAMIAAAVERNIDGIQKWSHRIIVSSCYYKLNGVNGSEAPTFRSWHRSLRASSQDEHEFNDTVASSIQSLLHTEATLLQDTDRANVVLHYVSVERTMCH